jgi:hypothetical protein
MSEKGHKQTYARSMAVKLRLAGNEQPLSPLLRKECSHLIQETGEGWLILKDEVIAAR